MRQSLPIGQTQKALTYFYETFKRKGVDDKGGQITIYVNSPTDLDHKSCFNNIRSYSHQKLIILPPPSAVSLPSLDSMAHEVGHLIVSYTNGDLDNTGESGALGESLADIIGTLVEFHSTPSTAEWTIMEDLVALESSTTSLKFWQNHMRYLNDPKLGQDPEQRYDPFWKYSPPTDERTAVHSNCSVL